MADQSFPLSDQKRYSSDKFQANEFDLQTIFWRNHSHKKNRLYYQSFKSGPKQGYAFSQQV
jgi:hypothetical protein